MSRVQTDEFVWLHGGRVIKRKPMGKGDLVITNQPLKVEQPTFEITTKHKGILNHLQAMRLNDDILCWQTGASQ